MSKPNKNPPKAAVEPRKKAPEPDWLKETPDIDPPYCLIAQDDGDWLQEIHVTRDEYVALKVYLHELRGGRYKVPEKEESTDAAGAH